MDFFHRNRIVSEGSDGYHRNDFLPPKPTWVKFFLSILRIEHGLFHRNRFVSDRSPPLVGLYTSALPVFRSRGRGYDWNLVDSIGQPSIDDEFIFGAFNITCAKDQYFGFTVNGFLFSLARIAII